MRPRSVHTAISCSRDPLDGMSRCLSWILHERAPHGQHQQEHLPLHTSRGTKTNIHTVATRPLVTTRLAHRAHIPPKPLCQQVRWPKARADRIGQPRCLENKHLGEASLGGHLSKPSFLEAHWHRRFPKPANELPQRRIPVQFPVPQLKIRITQNPITSCKHPCLRHHRSDSTSPRQHARRHRRYQRNPTLRP